jgi:hypothetical protein
MRRPRSHSQLLRAPHAPRAVHAALAALAACALAIPLAGCPGELADPGRFVDGGGGGGGTGGGSTCPDTPTFLATTCIGSGCHGSDAPVEGLDLQSSGVFTRLSGKKAMGGPGMLIDPTDPTKSVLYLKLLNPPPFGSRMPLVGTPLSDAQVACVLSWIESSN